MNDNARAPGVSMREHDRKIAAILAADVVDYSRLMGVDEESTLAALKLRRSIFDRLVTEYGGHEFGSVGDSLMAQFPSAVNAVRCAQAIQQAVTDENTSLPSERRMQLRIGINLGDVIEENGTLFGDGVNVAARLQALAAPGGILISGAVYEQVRNKVTASLGFAGERQVKNVTNPVATYEVLQSHQRRSFLKAFAHDVRRRRVAIGAVLVALIAGGLWYWRSDLSLEPHPRLAADAEPSIAVLPFANTSDDPNNEYFSDGLSEELISALSRLGGLRVIGRTSSFLFKNKTGDSKVIGEQLGVGYLLEGSVRKSSSRVRIGVALVSCTDGTQVWSGTYDRKLEDIFAVQSEIAGAVANQLAVTLHDAGREGTSLATSGTQAMQNVEAYNALLQGSFYSMRRTAEGYRKAIGYFEEAIRLEPRYALAYAKLSAALVDLATRYAGVGSPEGKEALAKARTATDSALALDPALGEAHRARGMLLERVEFDVSGAEREYRRAVEFSPQDSRATQSLANVTGSLGRLDEAVELTRRAIVLDPLRSESRFNLAVLLIVLKQYDEAEATLGKAMELQPKAAQNYLWLAIIAIFRGTPADAVKLAEQETDPFWRTYGLALAQFSNGDRVQADLNLKTLIDGNAGDAGSQIASVYALRRDSEQVFRWLDHAWETRDPGVLELRINPLLLAFEDDPRFTAFARKIGVMPAD
ncbi:MAG TPA: adenylate/guanylate cyclase domain-containing protein [Steroidobacteraceae bacterium]|nr:adenylate/guanylate cyclase domain-containing protein [Steroidobacteraceae bacterium]